MDSGSPLPKASRTIYGSFQAQNGAAIPNGHHNAASTDGANSSAGQALLARAHQCAVQEGLRPPPLPTDASAPAQLSAANRKRISDQQALCLAAYRRMLNDSELGWPSAQLASELRQIDTMLRELFGKDGAALLEQRCALLLASAELDAYCAEKLELAHRPICGLPITRKVAWDFVAGAFAFIGCFGPGTFGAKFFGIPWISFALNPITWMLSERLIPLVRMTTWRSEPADSVYPKIARANVRRAKFGWARCCGLRVKAPKIHRPTEKEPDRKLTQKEYVRELGGSLASTKAYFNKVKTDDVPYYFYSLLYGARGIAWDLTVRSPALRIDPWWRALNATTHCVSGTAAGALTMVTIQQGRKAQCRAILGEDKYASAEKLTETPDIQRLKLKKLQAELALLKAEQAQPLGMKSHLDIEEKLSLKEAQIRNAQARCTWSGLIWAEMTAGFQTDWAPDFADQQFFGEVPGEKFDTICGLLGKYNCLLVYMLLITQISWFTVDPKHDSDLEIVLKNMVANFLLIAPPNFSLRSEWTIVYLFLLGMVDLLTQPARQFFGCGDYVHHEENERVIVPDHETRATLRSRSSFMSLGELPVIEPMSDDEDALDQGPTTTNSGFPPLSSIRGRRRASEDEDLSSTVVDEGDGHAEDGEDDGRGIGLASVNIDGDAGGDDAHASAKDEDSSD